MTRQARELGRVSAAAASATLRRGGFGLDARACAADLDAIRARFQDHA